MKRLVTFLIWSVFLIPSCSRGIQKNNSEAKTPKIPAEAIHPLETTEDLDVLMQAIGDARIVLLGEATHGTSEFYTWRAKISKRLLEEKGFTIIAVEADWSDAYPLNNFIRGNSSYPTAKAALKEFDRWPEWMWANEEIADLSEWLKNYNSGKSAPKQAGFYGLDVYGMWESLNAVHSYLSRIDPEAAVASKAVLDCFAPYNLDEQAYARSTINSSQNCADELSVLLSTVRSKISENLDEAAFNLLQNTLVVVNAENYYRTAVTNYPLSWNIRDQHMTLTIQNLLDFHGPDAKIIVWEHNTHVGDARATDMANGGLVNVGQLVREEYGQENVFIVGFGTYSGKVIAASAWGANPKELPVPRAKRHSWEWLLHQAEPEGEDKLILMAPLQGDDFFENPIGHRAIGVVYDPVSETGSYVPSLMPKRYDAFIFIDKSTALNPIR